MSILIYLSHFKVFWRALTPSPSVILFFYSKWWCLKTSQDYFAFSWNLSQRFQCYLHRLRDFVCFHWLLIAIFKQSVVDEMNYWLISHLQPSCGWWNISHIFLDSKCRSSKWLINFPYALFLLYLNYLINRN